MHGFLHYKRKKGDKPGNIILMETQSQLSNFKNLYDEKYEKCTNCKLHAFVKAKTQVAKGL